MKNIRVPFSISPAGKVLGITSLVYIWFESSLGTKNVHVKKVLLFVSCPGTSATSIPLKKATRCKASEATLRKQATVRIASTRALGTFYPNIDLHSICLSSMS